MGGKLDEIPIARPALGDAEVAAAARPIRAGWVMQGPEVASFEAEFAEFVSAPHACAVSSGTAALHLALLVAGVKAGDEVITVSHSFIATANAIRMCGALPVFVDIEAATLNLDARLLPDAITARTRAILVVHQLGMPADLPAILAVAEESRVPVIEDAACAVASEIRIADEWQRIGRPHGDAACFSFHPRKLLTTGEGGMVTTRRPEWDATLRQLRDQGAQPASPGSPSFTAVGYNYRLTDIQAAVGREQLRRLPSLVDERRSRAQRYTRLFERVPGIDPPQEPDWARSNWQSYCVRLSADCRRDGLVESLAREGVATRPGITCAHREPAYPRSTWSCAGRRDDCSCAEGCCDALPESAAAQDHSLMLPLFPGIADADQQRVVDAIARAVASS